MSRIVVISLMLSAAAAAAPRLDASLFNCLQWRMVGPFRGGRVNGVSGVPGRPHEFYFGSVGAIGVSPSNPDVVYVGTGEADMRSQNSFGNGMYKSTDAGKSWTHIGL